MAEAVRPIHSKKDKVKLKKKCKDKLLENDDEKLCDDICSEQEDTLSEICNTYSDVDVLEVHDQNTEGDQKIHENVCDRVVCDNVKTNTCNISENNYVDLNKQLNKMEPYLQVNKQISKLQLNEEDNVVVSSNIPSAPQISEKDLKILECLSPNLSKPNHLLVRQRCLEINKDAQSDSQVTSSYSESLNIKPYTKIQLLALYNNLQLDGKDTVINSFLEFEKNTSQNKFYEIVLNYLRARTNLIGTEKEIKAFMDDYKKQKECIWTFEERVITEEGTCEDDQLLSVKCNYEIATYQPNIAKHIAKQLKQIRECLFDSHSLHIYTAEISKLQVENNLNNIISSCKKFKSLPKSGPVCCQFGEHTKDIAGHVKNLKECISVLMSFCRRNVKDIVFLRDVKAWLSDTVALLVRVATSQDHLFIVNHLMRCPLGVGDWGSLFIQVVPPSVNKEQDLFGSLYLDHLVTVLSILLEPVKERENFLRHFRAVNTPDVENKSDSSWIVLDSSGEDEEDTTETWHYFNENDIIQFLNQIPFEEMFKHILLAESLEDSVKYDVEKSTEHCIIKLFAFCTQLLKIFEQGLQTYHQARFKGVVKRLSRLIRHSVNYVTDHFKGVSEMWKKKRKIYSMEDNAMTLRLQVEYDEFFENAVKTVFLSPRCGAWQFLAVIPYDTVSIQRLWKIAYKLHVGYEDSDGKLGDTAEDWQSLLGSDDTKGRFYDRLAALGDSESYYLLTALANMAIVRSDHERPFIECIVSNIFDATFVNEDLRSTLNRTGRDLFLAITGSHSFTISSLIAELQEKLNSVGSLALYLFRFISLDSWNPSEDDLQCLSYWLSYTPASSLESNLSRVIIAKMNWGFSSAVDSLALPRAIHERIALLIVEVSMKINSKLGQGNLISEGVKQVTSVVYAPSPEQVCLKWCWSMLNQLHLHQMDQPEAQVRAVLANQSLILRGIGDPFITPSLEPLKKGLAAKHPLLVFAAMLMSSWGHSVPEICNNVPENLELLVSNGHSEAALTILSLIVPLFYNQHEELVSDTRFVNALQCILISDQTYMNLAKSYISSDARGKTVNVFKGLILDQISNCRKFNLENASPVVKFWIDFLVLVPNWTNNLSVLKLMDVLCQVSITDPKSMQLLKEVFTEQHKMICDKTGKGGLGGLLTWVSSSSGGQTSLLSRSFAAEVPWFALCVLKCELQEEIRSGVWKGLLRYLHNNSTATLETAIKEVCSDIQIDPISLNSLVLYRLGQQLLDLPSNHIAYPATVQIFLTFHLARTPPQTGQFDCSSVIYKFYEGYINANFLKKIKYSLSDALTYWESELAKEKNKDPEDQSETEDKQNRRRKFLTKLVSTLGTMSSWMEETRLYETGLYVPALPPQLMPKKLLHIFQENLELWPELINKEVIKAEMDVYLRCWSNHRQYTLPSTPLSSAGSSPSHRLSDSKECRRSYESLTPAEAIVKRFGEYDLPKPPPPLPAIIHKYSRSKEKPLNRESVLYDIDRFTDLIANHARSMLLKSKEMCAFDCVYVELLPQLWTNPVTKKVLTAKCQPKRSSKLDECSGPASIVVEYCEKRINEGIKARLEQNREHYLSIYNFSSQGPALQVCEAALQLEELVSNVVSWHKNTQKNAEESASLIIYGRELFYQFVQLTSEETNSYPPAKQLITSCADALGHEFLHCHEDCQESLALQVLQSESHFGVLLSPHFTPMVTSVEAYLSSYAALGPSVPSHPDLCFMLLSKFEMESWLRARKVGRHQRSKLIKCVCHSLSSIIATGDEATVMCLELYRVHLRALLNYNFPEHFAEILLQLLDMSVASADCGNVRRNLWFDFLNTLSVGIVVFTPEMTNQELQSACRRYAEVQILLSPAMVKDTIALLSSHFVHQRVEYGLYGLYSKYKSDVVPIVMLLGMISFTYILSAPMTSQQTGENLCQEIWLNIEGLWTAWVAPLGGKARASCPQWIQELTLDKSVLLPWTPGDVTAPARAVGVYTFTLTFFHDTCVDYRILSRLLEYYYLTYASSAVKDHILSVVHSQLCSLPWHHLEPSLKDLELISKIMNEYLPECHSFIGNIFTQISWDKVVQNFVNESESVMNNFGDFIQSPESKFLDEGMALTRSPIVKLHVLLLSIFVRISMEPSVRQNGLLHPLLLSAVNFEWHLVDAKNFEAVLNWFVMSCDPRIALEMNNRNPIDISLIQLLQVAAGYNHCMKSKPHRSGSLKRRLFVRSICRLLTTAATRHKALLNARKDLFGSTFFKVMSHMEAQVVEGLPREVRFEEGFFLSAEAINVIAGGASPPALQEVCRDHLLNWLSGSHPSREFLMPLLAAISKGVLHLHHRSPLIEESIAAIFNYADSFGEKENLYWYDVIRILSFPVTNPTPMLTFAAQENHLLVIYVHTKWRLHVRHVPPSEYICVLANLMEILSLIYPDERCENWLLLLVGETIDLIVTEIKKGEDFESVWRHTNTLTDFLTSWGEDRSSAGILAAIGLGKRSPLSSRVRLVCKCLTTFMKSQLISPGYFCSINEHKRNAEDDVDSTSYNSSLKLLHRLLALRTNVTYTPFLPALNYAIDFTQESSNSITETCVLFDGVLAHLFPKGSALLQLRSDDGSEFSMRATIRPEKYTEVVSPSVDATPKPKICSDIDAQGESSSASHGVGSALNAPSAPPAEDD